MPMSVSKEMPYVSINIGKQRGMFLLDYGANVSSIDLKAMPGLKPLQGTCDPALLHRQCGFEGFAFAGNRGPVYFLTADYAGLTLDFRQAGVIGTDFLSEHAYALHYGKGSLSLAPRERFCSPATLAAAGFSPMSAAGYFSSDLAKLLPLSSLKEDYSGSLTVPNIPTVPVRVAGVDAVAQIDTGYSDYIVRHSVNINPAFYSRIAAAAPDALVRWPEDDKKLSTCVAGVLESVEAYRLKKGAIEFMSAAGTVIRSFPSAVLYVKRTPPEAVSCGGISTYTKPAAQLGGSFMADLGTVVFDPFSSRVWARK
jgi:hypothetical protein